MLGRNICNMVRLHDYTVIPNKTENKSQQKKKKRKKNWTFEASIIYTVIKRNKQK